MDEKEIKKIKKLELEILEYVHDICIENNLKYYLVGGTLLGAIRHKGFIPWDDDIDIGMFRHDYDRLREILSDKKSEKYFLQHYTTDPDYTRYITKIRVNGTKFVEKSMENLNIHHGVFIDIFPLDKIKKEKSAAVRLRALSGRLLLRFYAIKSGNTSSPSAFKSLIMKVLKAPLVFIPKKTIIGSVERLYTMSDGKDCRYVTNFGSRYGCKKQTYPVEVFGEGTLVDFENKKFIAPAKWETILKRLYGDYMQYPPEDKRNSGHIVVHVDLGKYSRDFGD